MLNLLKKIFTPQNKSENNNEIQKPPYTDEYLNTGEYLSCKSLHGGIAFMHTAVRTCCSNKQGVTFFENYKGEDIDWKEVEKQRAHIIDDCKRGCLPENCKGCVDLEKKKWDEKPLIDDLFFNYWDHCNCGCVYCIQSGHGEYLVKEKHPSTFYSVLKQVKYLYDNNLVSKNAHVELVGGDLTVLDEAEDLINMVLDYGVGRMSFHSSCIFYSKGLERALKEAPDIDCDFSIDCASRELYKKIKRIDAFDQVIENIKRYLNASENAKKALIAKYIIVDGLNDNVEELDRWIELMHSIGIQNMKVDINFKKYFPEFHHENPTVPEHYYKMYEHYNKKIKEYGIRDCCWEFSKRVLAEGGIPKGY